MTVEPKIDVEEALHPFSMSVREARVLHTLLGTGQLVAKLIGIPSLAGAVAPLRLRIEEFILRRGVV